MTGSELDIILDAELVTDDPAALAERADINDTLTAEAAEDLANSGRDRTRGTYEERWKAFAKWCAANGRIPGPPTTGGNLTSYISHLKRTDTAPGTLRMAIAAIQHMNARAGYPKTPDTAAALKIYQDHRYEWAKAGRGQRSSAPVDLERLRQMLTACSPGTTAGQRNRVLLLLGYYMRARASELAQLRVGDLEFIGDDLLLASKRVSKNDKTSEGREYEIDDPDTINAVRAWLATLAAHGQAAPQLPLLRNVDMWDNIGAVGKTGYGISRQAINSLVKTIAQTAGVGEAENITAHGLRAGVPTDLGAQGFSAGEIKDITGADWASLEMVEKYRKNGLRRAGKSTQSERRTAALSALRITPKPPETEG